MQLVRGVAKVMSSTAIRAFAIVVGPLAIIPAIVGWRMSGNFGQSRDSGFSKIRRGLGRSPRG